MNRKNSALAILGLLAWLAALGPANADVFSERQAVLRLFGPGKRLAIGVDCRGIDGLKKILWVVPDQGPNVETDLPADTRLVIFADTAGHSGGEVQHEDKKEIALKMRWLFEPESRWITLARVNKDTEKAREKRLKRVNPKMSRSDIEAELWPGVLEAVIEPQELRPGTLLVVFDHHWRSDSVRATLNIGGVTLEEFLGQKALTQTSQMPQASSEQPAPTRSGDFNPDAYQRELDREKTQTPPADRDAGFRRNAGETSAELNAKSVTMGREMVSTPEIAMVEYQILVARSELKKANDESLLPFAWWVDGHAVATRPSDQIVRRELGTTIVGVFPTAATVSVALPKGTAWRFFRKPGEPRSFYVWFRTAEEGR